MEKIETKQKLLSAATVLCLILGVLCIVGCVFGFFIVSSVSFRVTAVVEVISVCFALYYFIRGAKKDAAKYYKAFLILIASSYVIENLPYLFRIVTEYELDGVGVPLFEVLLFANTLFLAFVKDIGKKAAYIFCAENVVFYAYAFVTIMTDKTIPTFQFIPVISIALTWLMLAVMMFIMTVAKYLDKGIRYTEKALEEDAAAE